MFNSACTTERYLETGIALIAPFGDLPSDCQDRV